MDAGDHRRQQPVGGHGGEDPALAIEQHQDHGGDPDQRAQIDEQREPGQADGTQAQDDRIGHVQLAIRHQAGQHRGHGDVEHGRDGERTQDADRHVALRPARLLGAVRDRVEPDIGDEHDGGAAHDAAHAKFAESAAVGRNEGVPVGGVHVEGAEADEGQHDRELDRDHDVVQPRRFPGAADQQRRDQHHDGRRRQVDDGGGGRAVGQGHHLPRRRREPRRQAEPHRLQQTHEVARPADGDRRAADGIFQDQIPADDPGRELAQRGIGVGIGAAGNRQERRQLGVAEADEGTGDRGQHEGQHDGRPGIQRRHRAGEDEDAAADDGADAHGRDADGPEDFGYAPVGGGDDVGNGFAREEKRPVCHCATRPSPFPFLCGRESPAVEARGQSFDGSGDSAAGGVALPLAASRAARSSRALRESSLACFSASSFWAFWPPLPWSVAPIAAPPRPASSAGATPASCG